MVDQTVKHLPAMRETWVQSLGWEDPLEKEMAPHSSILAWKMPWTEEPGRLQSIGSQRVGHDWENSLRFTSIIVNTTQVHIHICWWVNRHNNTFLKKENKIITRKNSVQGLSISIPLQCHLFCVSLTPWKAPLLRHWLQRLEVCWERTYTTPTPSALLLTDQDSLNRHGGGKYSKKERTGEKTFSPSKGYLQLHPPPEDLNTWLSNSTLPIPPQYCHY